MGARLPRERRLWQAQEAALLADDCRDGDDMIGFGRVLESEHEAGPNKQRAKRCQAGSSSLFLEAVRRPSMSRARAAKTCPHGDNPCGSRFTSPSRKRERVVEFNFGRPGIAPMTMSSMLGASLRVMAMIAVATRPPLIQRSQSPRALESFADYSPGARLRLSNWFPQDN